MVIPYNIWEQRLVSKQNQSTNTRADATQSHRMNFKFPGNFIPRLSSLSEDFAFINAPTGQVFDVLTLSKSLDGNYDVTWEAYLTPYHQSLYPTSTSIRRLFDLPNVHPFIWGFLAENCSTVHYYSQPRLRSGGHRLERTTLTLFLEFFCIVFTMLRDYVRGLKRVKTVILSS